MVRALRIKDFPNYYITDTGDVYSRDFNNTGRIKKLLPKKDNHGYMIICLCKNGKRHYKKIHRLVASAFIPNIENKTDVNHKNGIKTDNNLTNLEWATRHENLIHKYRILKYKPINTKIVLQLKNGKIINEFYGLREAERKTGVCFAGIYQCCIGNFKQSGGYQWRYKEKIC